MASTFFETDAPSATPTTTRMQLLNRTTGNHIFIRTHATFFHPIGLAIEQKDSNLTSIAIVLSSVRGRIGP